jgi:NAD+ kinase
MTSQVMFVVHGGRPRAVELAQRAAQGLLSAGVSVMALADEAEQLGVAGIAVAVDAQGCDLVVVFGGDGTILRAIEYAKPSGAAGLGVNLGHVGFLAEAEPENIDSVIEAIVVGHLTIDERVAVKVTATLADGTLWTSWGLNEVAIEKHFGERMARLAVSIDGLPVSQWDCDGLLCATPTGSTAYAFSAGGPVVWPQVDAFLVVPVSAHSLFARPLVVSPSSRIEIEVLGGPVVVTCDGRRTVEISPSGSLTITRDHQMVRFARVHATPFTERLVAKFQLPSQGWRA